MRRALNDPLVPWEEPVYLHKVSHLLMERSLLAGLLPSILAHPREASRVEVILATCHLGMGLTNAFLTSVPRIDFLGKAVE